MNGLAGSDSAGGDFTSGAPGFTGAGGAAVAGGAAGSVGGSSDAGSAGQTGVAATPGRDTCFFPKAAEVQYVTIAPGFCAWVWAAGVGKARGIKTDDLGNVLVVSSAYGTISALWDDDHDGVSNSAERVVLATLPGLNHGLALHDGYLYASTPGEVYRWKYAADRKPLGAPEPVITGMPTDGHATRTLAVDSQFLYLSIGSKTNEDGDSSRARVVRFPWTSLGAVSVPFSAGVLFADGLRNTVGLGFDANWRLWGVENGQDDVMRQDLGGDIHEDNPAEELNLLADPGGFYGFPYCWSEFTLPAGVSAGRGAQWANSDFMKDGIHSDAWCRANSRAPALALQAHSAPLDILFYEGSSFPSSFRGGAFISFHGSHDRTQLTGYDVEYLAFDQHGVPGDKPKPIFGSVLSSTPGFRPVSLTTLPNGVLLVSNDFGDPSVIAIGYTPP